MCIFSLLFIVSGAMVWFAFGAGNEDKFRISLPANLGAGMVLGSFIFLAWISFAPLDFFINIFPDLIEDNAMDTISWLVDSFGQANVAKLISLVTSIGYLPGWLLVIFIPTRSLWLRLTIALTGLTGLIGFLGIPFNILIKKIVILRLMAGSLASLSLITSVVLLFHIPEIQAWGSSGTFLPGLLTLIAGVQMGSGVWVAWLGLLLMGFGNLLIFSKTVVSRNYDDEELDI